MFNLCSAQSLNIVQLFTKATVVTVQNLLAWNCSVLLLFTYRLVDRIGIGLVNGTEHESDEMLVRGFAH